MGRPKGGYKNAAGKRVPGVTTIISRFKDSGGLIHWAWNEGMEGRDYRDSRDKAANAGTIAHAMVEHHLTGKNIESDLPDVDAETMAKARDAHEAYLQWERQSKIDFLAIENALVSEVHQVGGTIDGIGVIDDKLCVIDFKTSNAIYQDALIQVATYEVIWNENHPEAPITGGAHILRFAKEHGDFAHHHYPNLDEAFRQFVLFREAYEIDKVLKKRV